MNNFTDRRSTILEMALKYAALGYQVYPAYPIKNGQCSCKKKARCEHPGKHPRNQHGFKDATTDLKVIRQFCQSGFAPNIGLRTGEKFIVLDFDKKNGGLETLRELEERYGPMPVTPTVVSGGGGFHFYFKHPGYFVKTVNGIRQGLDIRGDNGSIIAMPSLHISEAVYTWVEGKALWDIPLAEVPAWFSEIQTAKTDKIPHNPPNATAIEDGVRNATLFKRACRLLRDGFTNEAIYAAISVDNKILCNPPVEDSEIKNLVASAVSYRTEWPPIGTLPDLETDAPSLEIKLIPPSFRGWVQDISERYQVPLDMAAIPLLVAIAGTMGRRVRIIPKKYDDWEVVPNLWGGIVAPPSSLKSPILTQALTPLYAIQKRLDIAYQEAMSVYELQSDSQKQLMKKLETEYAAASSNGEDGAITEVVGKILGLKNKLDEQKPRHTRLLVNDATTEKLIEILSENPHGTIVFRDELNGFLKSLEKKGREGDRPFYLESWSGNSPFTQDRVQRGSVRVNALCLSILGGIQPNRLKEYFESLLEEGDSDDGFLQRFQLLVWPTLSKNFKLIDREPNKASLDQVKSIFNKIVNLDSRKDLPIKVRFSPNAQLRFNAWLTALEFRVRSGEISSQAFVSHLGKYRSLMPKLAGIFQFIEDIVSLKETHEISSTNTTLAIKWCEYLEGHAMKIYASSINSSLHIAHLLAKKISSGDIYDGMSIRDLVRNQWSGLRSREQINLGLEYLQGIGWLKQQEVKGPSGPPSAVLRLNPSLSLSKNKTEVKDE